MAATWDSHQVQRATRKVIQVITDPARRDLQVSILNCSDVDWVSVLLLKALCVHRVDDLMTTDTNITGDRTEHLSV